MAKADISETLNVAKDRLFEVITNYEDYPKFVDGCKSAKVERTSERTARVTYHINMMKDIVYTLEHTEDRENGRMSWKLLEGDVITKNNGSWQLKGAGDKTDVKYEVEVEFSIPAPGFIVNKLIKGSLPKMINFETQAQKA